MYGRMLIMIWYLSKNVFVIVFWLNLIRIFFFSVWTWFDQDNLGFDLKYLHFFTFSSSSWTILDINWSEMDKANKILRMILKHLAI